MIPVEESFAEWRKDPNYVEAYDALEDEFPLAAALIEARAHAGLTQQQLADYAHDAGGHRAPGKRPGQALDPHPRTPRRRNRNAAAHLLRAVAGEVRRGGVCVLTGGPIPAARRAFGGIRFALPPYDMFRNDERARAEKQRIPC